MAMTRADYDRRRECRARRVAALKRRLSVALLTTRILFDVALAGLAILLIRAGLFVCKGIR